jgi:hypothetical protein
MEYIGKLDGFPVYKTVKKNIIDGNWKFNTVYIIIDDENKLFKNGYIFGKTDSTLTRVQEYGGYSYKYKPSKIGEVKENKKEEKVSVAASEEATTDIDKILEASRNITVKDLVGEFSYDTY